MSDIVTGFDDGVVGQHRLVADRAYGVVEPHMTSLGIRRLTRLSTTDQSGKGTQTNGLVKSRGVWRLVIDG